jgi:hypothetical protein
LEEIDGAGALVWLIAIAGLVLGGLGCVVGMIGHRRSAALQTRLVQLEDAQKAWRAREAKRARLRATIQQAVEVRWYLAIENDGHGDASDLTVSIDGMPLASWPFIDPKVDLGALGEVAGHGGVRIPLQTTTRPDALQLELTWTDASGELGFFQGELGR